MKGGYFFEKKSSSLFHGYRLVFVLIMVLAIYADDVHDQLDPSHMKLEAMKFGDVDLTRMADATKRYKAIFAHVNNDITTALKQSHRGDEVDNSAQEESTHYSSKEDVPNMVTATADVYHRSPEEILRLKSTKSSRKLVKMRQSLTPHIKKGSCKNRKCALDLSLIDTEAAEIDVPLGMIGITGVDGTVLKRFKKSRNTPRKGYWNGEIGYSSMSLLKQRVGPKGVDLWFGSIHDSENDIYYDISPNANGTLIVATAMLGSELLPSIKVQIPADFGMLHRNTNVSSQTSSRRLTDDGSIIDIMFVWTMAAECTASGLVEKCTLNSQTEKNMRGKLDVAIAQTNQIYLDSGILTQLRLVYAYRQPAYVAKVCDSGLIEMRNPSDGIMDDVHNFRNQYKADMVQLVMPPCGICGAAYMSGDVIDTNYMFSVVNINCLLSYSPAHELGHNMGCNHDRGSSNMCSSVGYNFGYRNPTASFRDVMSYDCDSCACNLNCGNTSRCPKVARIANTASLYNGLPIGNTNNNCARTINENRKAIASLYNSFAPTKPVTPASFPIPSVKLPVTPAMTPIPPAKLPVKPIILPIKPAKQPKLLPIKPSKQPKLLPIKPALTPITPAKLPVTPIILPITPPMTPLVPLKLPVNPVVSPVFPAKVPVILKPTNKPTRKPTKKPTKRPTRNPTKGPTRKPTKKPTERPTKKPTKMPSRKPTKNPSKAPSKKPTKMPTKRSTKNPSKATTKKPTKKPSATPSATTSSTPHAMPTTSPSVTRTKPTKKPTKASTKKSSDKPTKAQTEKPTKAPTNMPTKNQEFNQ